MQVLENFASEAQERVACAIAGSCETDVDLAIDSAGRLGHDDDPITHVDGFINVMRDEEHCRATVFPQPQHFILHPHACESVERTERFIEQENFGMIDKCACKGNSLSHATGKMMRIRIRKRFEPDQPHEFVHFIAFFSQYTASNQAGFDIPANRQPRKQVRVLENKTAFCAGSDNLFIADKKVSRIWNIQAGDESKQRRLSTSARAN
jgi:hypothetical protein